MLKRYGDIISGVFFLLLGAWMYLDSYAIKSTTLGKEYGSHLMPRAVGIVMVVLSAVVLAGALRNALKRVEAEAGNGNQGEKGRRLFNRAGFQVFLSAASMLLYAIFLDRVGFVIMTTLLVFVQMLILSRYEMRKSWMFAVVAAGFSYCIFYVFTEVFNLVLPYGILG